MDREFDTPSSPIKHQHRGEASSDYSGPDPDSEGYCGLWDYTDKSPIDRKEDDHVIIGIGTCQAGQAMAWPLLLSSKIESAVGYNVITSTTNVCDHNRTIGDLIICMRNLHLVGCSFIRTSYT